MFTEPCSESPLSLAARAAALKDTRPPQNMKGDRQTVLLRMSVRLERGRAWSSTSSHGFEIRNAIRVVIRDSHVTD